MEEPIYWSVEELIDSTANEISSWQTGWMIYRLTYLMTDLLSDPPSKLLYNEQTNWPNKLLTERKTERLTHCMIDQQENPVPVSATVSELCTCFSNSKNVSATGQVSNKLTKWVIKKLADNLISKRIQILKKEPYEKVTKWLNDKLTKWLITKAPSNVLIFQITDSSNDKLPKAKSELLTNWMINWPTKVTDWLVSWLTD